MQHVIGEVIHPKCAELTGFHYSEARRVQHFKHRAKRAKLQIDFDEPNRNVSKKRKRNKYALLTRVIIGTDKLFITLQPDSTRR